MDRSISVAPNQDGCRQLKAVFVALTSNQVLLIKSYLSMRTSAKRKASEPREPQLCFGIRLLYRQLHLQGAKLTNQTAGSSPTSHLQEVAKMYHQPPPKDSQAFGTHRAASYWSRSASSSPVQRHAWQWQFVRCLRHIGENLTVRQVRIYARTWSYEPTQFGFPRQLQR